jgi:hypothetical protein
MCVYVIVYELVRKLKLYEILEYKPLLIAIISNGSRTTTYNRYQQRF